MNLYFLFFIASVFSLKENIPKYCVKCKYFKKATPFVDDKHGSCLKFPVKNISTNDLVTGVRKELHQIYHFCDTARSFELYCGKEGKFYEEK
jgi:hypothetical protein